MDCKKTAIMFKAFCDENRLQILSILQSGEKCACKLLDVMQITQPTLSHHMKILCDAGVVNGRKEGKWMYYSISEEGLDVVINILGELKKSLGNEGDNYATIYGLYVDEKHRNGGIGSALIKSCEEELKNWNVKYMKLYVHKNTIDTDFLIKFYEKLGYEIFESSYSDEYCMLKKIKQ